MEHSDYSSDSGYTSTNTSKDNTECCKDTLQSLQDILKIKTSLIKYLNTENKKLKADLGEVESNLKLTKTKSQSLEQKLKDQDLKISYLEKKIETQKQIDQLPKGTDNNRDAEYEGDMTSRKYKHSKTKNKTQHKSDNRELLDEWGKQMQLEREVQMETHMAGLEVIGNQIKDTVTNLDFQNKLNNITTTLAIEDLVNDYSIGASKITELIHQIEHADPNEDTRKRLFITTVDRSIITLLDEQINTPWRSIKTLLYNQLNKIPETDIAINLRSTTWKGLTDPLIMYTDIKHKYDTLMFGIEPKIKFKNIIISSLTNSMKPEVKHTIKEMLDEVQILEGVKQLSKKYHTLGRDFFFENNKNTQETNKIHKAYQDNRERENRIIIFGLKNIHKLLTELNLNSNIIKKTFRINTQSHLGNPLPLNVEFRNQYDRNTFFKQYNSAKYKLKNIGVVNDIPYAQRKINKQLKSQTY